VPVRPALASPPVTRAPEPPVPARGFSLERGAWLATPHIGFGFGLLATLRHSASFSRDGVDAHGVSVPIVRPSLHARMANDKLRLLVQPELAGPSPRLLDAQLVYQPISAFGLELGQYRPHVSRAWNTPVPSLGLPDRGTVDHAFQPGRALGATVLGRPFAGKLEYAFGRFDAGGPKFGQPLQLEPLTTWRLAVNPLGPVPYTQTPGLAKLERPVFGFGVHGWTHQARPGIEGQRLTVGGDFVVMTEHIHVLVEGFGRWGLRKRRLLGQGWGSQAQIGVMVLERTLELHARAGILDPGRGQATQGTWEGGLSWYVYGNHLKAQIHHVCNHSFADSRGCESHRALVQTQLWF
jgi:hypothetical protein